MQGESGFSESGFTEPAWQGVAVLCKSKDGRSLLMVLQGQPHEKPTWAVPGGSIEPGETPEQAVAREMKEETGIDVCALGPYTVIEGVREYGPFQVHYYTVKTLGDKALSSGPDGLIHRVAWIPFHRLPDLKLTHEDQKQILSAFMSTESD
jgi:ADP-ribose pyrophosphatase YjhB (NUDIX family)